MDERSYACTQILPSLSQVSLLKKWDGDDMGGVSKIGMVKKGLIK